MERAGHLFRCPQCDTWYLEATPCSWGVPWDMPRPAPTRREAAPATAAPSSSSALPRRMAAAVGADGWLRLPPRHQQMHPVDVLVDGVLAALDGHVDVRAKTRGTRAAPEDQLTFRRLPLSDAFEEEGVTLDAMRRRLKQSVDRLMRDASATLFQEVWVEVRWGGVPAVIGRGRCC